MDLASNRVEAGWALDTAPSPGEKETAVCLLDVVGGFAVDVTPEAGVAGWETAVGHWGGGLWFTFGGAVACATSL